ncbi:pseudouridine synthase 7 isoform X2 [Arctopsyche grandis]|uniref:pseudouridine synthase 7 isoform X2 n=1 Tax=Arctopsyche grandis TaxID=121162 RepID=UPI00406D9046
MGWRGGRGGDRAGDRSGTPGRRLPETDVGITEYIRAEAGFHGLIKCRYSDFHVSEIAPNGDITKLTDLSPPIPTNQDKNQEEDEELNVLSKYNTEILSVEMWDKINAVALAKPQTPQKVEIDVTEMQKDQRTKIHDSVKKAFGKKIIGSTVTLDNKKFIVFTTYSKEARTDTREKWTWNGDYVHFILYKENCDTMEAVSLVAERLNMKHIKPAFFGYCGTKDRRGKTSQWISIKKVDPIKIINRCRAIHNITVGNFEFKNHNLKLGDLKGNRFKIALRNVTATDEVVQSAVESLRDNGFINYYGLQRFGSRADIPTSAIGKRLLQGNFEEAVKLILTPQGPFYKYLKIYKETENAQDALQGLNSHTSLEIKLLAAIKKEEINGSPKNFVSALNKIPRNTRLLYIHSYQSLIWNKCVSERLRRFGFKSHVGDLVLLNSADLPEEVNDVADDVIKYEDEDEESLKDNAETSPQIEMKENTDEVVHNSASAIKNLQVKMLTEEDVSSGNYTILDIVMPLPGFNIEYPSNMKEYYEQLLVEDGLTLQLKQKNKSYSLSGTYRHLVKKPENLSWKFMRYSDPVADLISSDLDELRRRDTVKNVPDGKFKALILEFNLSASTYATMALRELLKQDTSSEAQAQNNDYHLEVSEDKKKTDVCHLEKLDVVEELLSNIDSSNEKRKIDDEDQIECKKIKTE